MATAHHLVSLAVLAAAPPQTHVARVRSWLNSGLDASMLPRAACAPSIVFSGNLPGQTLKGADAYAEAARAWHSECVELLGPAYSTSVQRVALLSEEEVAVRWRAEWSPRSTRWLEGLAQAAGWEIERFDLDATATSAFSWRAVVELFAKAARTGRLALPTACIEGQALLRFEPGGGGLCVAHRQRLDVLALAAASRLRNRKVAADAAEFLDIRRPPPVAPDVWAVEVAAAVLVGVPGAGPLDIEPLADESEGAIALGTFALVALGALAATGRLAGDAAGTTVFGDSLCDDAESAYWYSQCVSDLFGG